MTSKYDLPMYMVWDIPHEQTDFDKIEVLPNNPIAAGIQHNEVIGRNSHCNFGVQSYDCIDMCRCIDVTTERPGWRHPDCPKMLPQYDKADLDYVLQVATTTDTCEMCGREYPKYLKRHAPDYDSLCPECFNENFFDCIYCGKTFSQEDMSGDYDYHCEDCADMVVGTCDECDELVYEGDDCFSDEDGILCEECAESHTLTCEWCDRTYRDDQCHCDDNTIVCDDCFDNHGLRCEECDRIIHQDDAYERHGDYFCEHCYEEMHSSSRCIRGYGYMPSLKFFNAPDDSDTEHDTYYGVELEMDQHTFEYDGDQDYDLMSDCADKLDELYGNILWMTTDGSLTDVGIEFKTHPMSFDYHMKSVPWFDICNKCKEYGYKSHELGTCGLHIHISKSAFGNMKSMQDGNIAKFLYIMEKFWPQMVKFSRRTGNSMDRWARKYNLANIQDTNAISEEAYNKNYEERHHCINLLRTDTVEVRIFRGTLNPYTLKASIQLCELMRSIAMNSRLDDIHNMSWDDFKNMASNEPDKYPELLGYFDRRHL